MSKRFAISLCLHGLLLLAAMWFAGPPIPVAMSGVVTASLEIVATHAPTHPDSAALPLPPIADSQPTSHRPPQELQRDNPKRKPGHVEPEPPLAAGLEDNRPQRDSLDQRISFPKATVTSEQSVKTTEPVERDGRDVALPDSPSEARPSAASSETQLLDSSVCDRPPAVLDVEWPRIVRRLFNGTVVVWAVIDADGRLETAKIETGSGRQDWDAAILDAMRAATFSPAIHDATSVRSHHKFRITFTN